MAGNGQQFITPPTQAPRLAAAGLSPEDQGRLNELREIWLGLPLPGVLLQYTNHLDEPFITYPVAGGADDEHQRKEIFNFFRADNPQDWILAFHENVILPLYNEAIRTNTNAAEWRMAKDAFSRELDAYDTIGEGRNLGIQLAPRPMIAGGRQWNFRS